MDIFDTLFLKEYHIRSYNCMHFFIDVWKDLFGVDASHLLPSVAVEEGIFKVIDPTIFKQTFHRLKEPKSPCAVVLRTTSNVSTHFATFYKKKILHITEIGVHFVPLEVASIGFNSVKFYEYTLHN